MNEVGVVISRFYEDLLWLDELDAPLDVYVYDRSGNLDVPDKSKYFYQPKGKPLNLNLERMKQKGVNVEIIPLEDDFGYETSTYSYYLYSRYDKLNDVTAFLQGHPQFYMKNIVTKLNNPWRFARTRYDATVAPPNLKLESPLKQTITEEPIEFTYLSDCFGYTSPSVDYGWKNERNDYTRAPFWFFLKNMPGWTENKEELKELGPFIFGAGNQFAVNKKLVLRHDVHYYKRIHDFVKSYMDESPDRPEWQQKNQGPNVMEATWQFVF